jgi:hypothetical protein
VGHAVTSQVGVLACARDRLGTRTCSVRSRIRPVLNQSIIQQCFSLKNPTRSTRFSPSKQAAKGKPAGGLPGRVDRVHCYSTYAARNRHGEAGYAPPASVYARTGCRCRDDDDGQVACMYYIRIIKNRVHVPDSTQTEKNTSMHAVVYWVKMLLAVVLQVQIETFVVVGVV